MHELGLDVDALTGWFLSQTEASYVMVRVEEAQVGTWPNVLGEAVRRCYIKDEHLNERSVALGLSREDVLRAKLPDAGATMAGDFGEIITYVFQADAHRSSGAFGPKKWRLKQDRSKPAPYSDVLHFSVPSWPVASGQDALFCAEVKTKSTPGRFNPIKAAIDDCEKDRTSRLAKTLVWLRDRAIGEDLGAVTVDLLQRFINAIDHPAYEKQFNAVAVVCAGLVQDELVNVPEERPTTYNLMVISIPGLQGAYTAVFDGALASLDDVLSASRKEAL
jgi:hypothetical protein